MPFKRTTRQRRTILDVLRSSRDHPTASDVYERVRDLVPTISLGTIYRNLDLLVEDGLIKRIDGAGKEMRFDADLSPHYHAHCIGCGEVMDLDASTLSGEVMVLPERIDGFLITECAIEFRGFCELCTNEDGAPPAGG